MAPALGPSPQTAMRPPCSDPKAVLREPPALLRTHLGALPWHLDTGFVSRCIDECAGDL
jgi:hypothetical protein